jgi:hypothetical protein
MPTTTSFEDFVSAEGVDTDEDVHEDVFALYALVTGGETEEGRFRIEPVGSGRLIRGSTNTHLLLASDAASEAFVKRLQSYASDFVSGT